MGGQWVLYVQLSIKAKRMKVQSVQSGEPGKVSTWLVGGFPYLHINSVYNKMTVIRTPCSTIRIIKYSDTQL